MIDDNDPLDPKNLSPLNRAKYLISATAAAPSLAGYLAWTWVRSKIDKLLDR